MHVWQSGTDKALKYLHFTKVSSLHMISIQNYVFLMFAMRFACVALRVCDDPKKGMEYTVSLYDRSK